MQKNPVGNENARKGKGESRSQISSLSVSGFKSLRNEVTVRFSQLTVLAGKNSSGKSSMMQPLLLMKQTLEAPYDPGALKIDGPNVAFKYSKEMCSRGSGRSSSQSFSIRIETSNGGYVEPCYAMNKAHGFVVPSMKFKNVDGEMTLSPGQKSDDLVRLLPPDYSDLMSEIMKLMAKKLDVQLGDQFPPDNLEVVRDRCFLGIALGKGETREHGTTLTVEPIATVRNALLRIIHLPGLRGNPERDYSVGAVGTNYPGLFQSYVASMILKWQENKSEHLQGVFADLTQLGLASSVHARRVTDASVELRVSRTMKKGTNDMVNIADVGVGVSQVLPVLVALHAAGPTHIVYVEQPEIHLHPRAQVQLAKCIASAIGRGTRVVLETHSSLLILSIQTLVALGELNSQLVSLHWFSHSDDGITGVSSRQLDEKGSFGDWPEDFAEVGLRAQKEYLDAVARRMFT